MSGLGGTNKAVPIFVAAAAVSLSVVGLFAWYNNQQFKRDEETETARADRGIAMDNIAVLPQENGVTSAPPPAQLTLIPAAAGSKALVVCPDGSEEALVAASWAAESRGAGAAVTVCPPGFLALHAKSAAGSYDFVVVEEGAGQAGEGIDVGGVLAQVLKLLKPNGKIAVVPHDGDASDSTTLATLTRELTFSGFVAVSQSTGDSRVIIGERPAWEVGASAPVRLSFAKKKPEANSAAVTAAANGSGSNGVSNGNGQKKTWKLALDDDVEGNGTGMEDDLVDEDALLEASAPVVKRVTESDAGGCATKRRACKDCSCGRAEMEAEENGASLAPAVVSLDNMDDVVTSACGNCSKGDAFRCASCPFLGKPTFEKGQEKLIMLADLDNQQDA